MPGVIGKLNPIKRHVGNFGDLLGPIIVEQLLAERGVSVQDAARTSRLLTVGSVMRLAREGDVVWGTGVNGKSLDAKYDFTDLDVRAVRGPLTRDYLLGMGIDVPPVFGDPGLLFGEIFDRDLMLDGADPRGILVVPNFNDFAAWSAGSQVVLDPRSGFWNCIRAIAASELVVGSSLHAIVIAESFGIPARLVSSQHEPPFKYHDYYLGTGRVNIEICSTVEHAAAHGGAPAPVWDSSSLRGAFPWELWNENTDSNADGGVVT